MNGFGTIMVFTNGGSFVTQWSGFGQAPGQLVQPQGIAIAAGEILVADTGNDRIQVFTPDGALLTAWGGFGSGPGRFWAPTGVARTPDGLVYVADKFNNRVEVFMADALTPTKRMTWGGLKNSYRQ